ncbi:DUF4129 domain-containing protein [Lusitaniella coriacea LEGE 07157]|uniref:DUF4129 domain-containing protein n=1 Tax=Lusitaniella coriacea LEGE 07157 TaxID=945747 RepID=A0A8J7DV36_9CYAN|nr:DUF4129 domain-containing protein [Lusitaniella coriacea]MBE9115557.1 DUF4129 domain-containing protein [Lusitaniella coriacea LEGE 07157]
MATGSYQKDGIGWQWHQFQTRLGEWWERLISGANIDRPNLPNFDSPMWEILARVVFWCVVVAFIAWLVWGLWKLLSPYLYAQKSPRDRGLPQKSTQGVSVSQWLARSRKFQQQGDYRQACICLYRAMLQQLHEKGIAPHKASRTDGEYLKIVAQLPQPQPYQTLLLTHQQLCFSNIDATASLFAQCQQAYQQIP